MMEPLSTKMNSKSSDQTNRPRHGRLSKSAPILLAAAALLALLVFMPGTDKKGLRWSSAPRLMMGTTTQIILWTTDQASGRAAAEAAFDQQQLVDDLMSDYRLDSELARVNAQAFEAPVTVDAATFTVLQRALEISRWSNGAFDVTIGPKVDLNRRAADSNTPPPTEAEYAEAQSKVGWEKLTLDPNERSVSFAVEGMRLDLGGIAKGYAIDRAIDGLAQCGVTDAMVDIGGDIRCAVGEDSDKSWSIGIQDPNVSDSDPGGPPAYLWVLTLKNKAVATSGHYRRYALIDGKKVSHIIDPQSGQGSDGLLSVTVLADDAMTADALATAVSVLGAQEGMALIEGLAGVEALLIVDDPTAPLTSSGMDAYLQ